MGASEHVGPLASLSSLRRHRWWRAGAFALGLVAFYAPFALIVRVTGWLMPATPAGTGIADVHSACLRMPIGWLVQPWMWGSLFSNPLYALTLVVLPVAALAAGPFFCGWLCPAGAFPELLSRAVPDRMKFDPAGRVHITAIRYGFFAGFLVVPFVSASVCCSLCNFGIMQNIVGLPFGAVEPWTYFSTTGLLTLALWIVPLGLFTKGGRGWCMFLCPVGAFTSMFNAAGARIGARPRVSSDAAACTSCATCADACSMRAVTIRPQAPVIDQWLCNDCLDCVAACPADAMAYRRSPS